MKPSTDEWETPAYILDPLDDEFEFVLDVCATMGNTKCGNYFTKSMDGLSRSWGKGTCWMNPPFGRGLEKWVKKAYESSQAGATVVCLLPARTETDWWHDYCMKGEIRFIRGRIHFIREDGKTGRPRFGNAIVIFRPGGK